MKGVYNAVAPEFTTNAQFMKTLSKVMKRPFFSAPCAVVFIEDVHGRGFHDDSLREPHIIGKGSCCRL